MKHVVGCQWWHVEIVSVSPVNAAVQEDKRKIHQKIAWPKEGPCLLLQITKSWQINFIVISYKEVWKLVALLMIRAQNDQRVACNQMFFVFFFSFFFFFFSFQMGRLSFYALDNYRSWNLNIFMRVVWLARMNHVQPKFIESRSSSCTLCIFHNKYMYIHLIVACSHRRCYTCKRLQNSQSRQAEPFC